MNETNPADRLDQLRRPTPAAPALKRELKLALLSARTSSRLGVLLVALPALFVFGVIVRYGFGLPVPGFAALERLVAWMEHQPYIPLLSPLVVAGAPLLALALNLLAILHVEWSRPRRELTLTLKLRWANLAICALCLLILAMVFVHLVAERPHP
jgi:hypothetical protein